jgi:hypothetical protein
MLLRLEFPPPRELDLLRLWGPRFAPIPLEREEPLLGREALLRRRVDADDFEPDEPPEERDEPLLDALPPEREDPLARFFEPEPFDEPLLLCSLREADLLVAILTPPLENIRSWLGYPAVGAITERAEPC